MTTAELRKAERNYQRAVAKAEAARETRNAAVRGALDAGFGPTLRSVRQLASHVVASDRSQQRRKAK